MRIKAKLSGKANYLQVTGITCLAIDFTCVAIIRLFGKPVPSEYTTADPIFLCFIAWAFFSFITAIVMVLKPRFLTLFSFISTGLIILLFILIKVDTFPVVNSTQDPLPEALLFLSLAAPTVVGISRFLFRDA